MSRLWRLAITTAILTFGLRIATAETPVVEPPAPEGPAVEASMVETPAAKDPEAAPSVVETVDAPEPAPVPPAPAEQAAAAPVDEPVHLGPFTLGNIVTTVHLDDMSIPGPAGFGEAPLVHWRTADMDVDLVAMLRGDTHVSQWRVAAPDVTLVRNADRAWNFVEFGRSSHAEAGTEPADDSVTPERSALFAVDEIVVTEGTLTMVDHAVHGPPATIVLTNLSMVMRDLFAPMPADQMRTTVDLRADWSDAPGSRLLVKGSGNFLHEDRAFDVRVMIKAAPLTLFSPYYTNRSITILGGVMDATIVGGCRENVLNAQVDMHIRELRVAEAGTNVASRIYGQTATQFVRLVHANRGNFDLSFPVTGSMDNPEFTMDTALGKQFAIAATSGIAAAADAVARAGRSLKGRVMGEPEAAQ